MKSHETGKSRVFVALEWPLCMYSGPERTNQTPASLRRGVFSWLFTSVFVFGQATHRYSTWSVQNLQIIQYKHNSPGNLIWRKCVLLLIIKLWFQLVSKKWESLEIKMPLINNKWEINYKCPESHWDANFSYRQMHLVRFWFSWQRNAPF